MQIFLNTSLFLSTEGSLKTIRDELFVKMQKLPIKYFDTHTHGDIMSRYTNDTDTLREMIGRGIPTMISSIMTILAVGKYRKVI